MDRGLPLLKKCPQVAKLGTLLGTLLEKPLFISIFAEREGLEAVSKGLNIQTFANCLL